MKLMRQVCLCAAAAVLAAGSAMASMTTVSARARVPFDFVVNGKTMPAGVYSFSLPNSAGMVTIRGETGSESALAAGMRTTTPAGLKAPQLIFVKKNGKLHLSTVLAHDPAAGTIFPVK